MNSNVIQIIGGIFIFLGLVDFGASYLGHDITGVQWSAYVLGTIGYALIHFSSKFESEEENEDIEEDIKEINSETSLWNPNVTANWSILFTPIFGGLIMSSNWKMLGKKELSEKSLIWAYIGIALIIITIGISFYLISTGDIITAGIVSLGMNIAFLIYFLVWRFTVAKEQIAYVKDTLPDGYSKKSWSKPFLSILGLYAFLIAIGVLIESDSFTVQDTYSKQTQLVREYRIDSCPNYTLEQLVDSEVIISNPTWETNITEDNEIFVNISGQVSYDGKPSEILIQFLFDKNNLDFAYNAYEIDGEAQESSMTNILFQTICENMSDTTPNKETKNLEENENNEHTITATFIEGEWYEGYQMVFENNGKKIHITSGDTLSLKTGQRYKLTYEIINYKAEWGDEVSDNRLVSIDEI